MKRIALLLALAVVGAAWAQSPAQKKAPPETQAAKPEAQKRAALARKSRRNEDARHCLERPNNTAIIKCAEEYL